MIFGSEPGSTHPVLRRPDDKPDFTETRRRSARGPRLRSTSGTSTSTPSTHGLTGAPVQYGLLDNARRARLGPRRRRLPPRRWRELFAPFSKVAAKNPFSSSPVERSVDEIDHRHRRQPDDLRPVSAAAGRPRSGQPGCRRGADVGGGRPSSRRARGEVGVPARARRHDRAGRCWTASISTYSSASVLAVQEALRVAGVGVDDIATFDLYSCFPFPVFAVCDGTRAGDRRPARADAHRRSAVLRRTGQQLLAARASPRRSAEMRDKPGQFGLVGANGGIMSKYSVGVYSTDAGRLAAGQQRRAARRGRRTAHGAGHGEGRRRRRPSRPTRCATTGRCAPASSSAGSMPTTAGSWL